MTEHARRVSKALRVLAQRGLIRRQVCAGRLGQDEPFSAEKVSENR